jgi:hypothetical protein
VLDKESESELFVKALQILSLSIRPFIHPSLSFIFLIVLIIGSSLQSTPVLSQQGINTKVRSLLINYHESDDAISTIPLFIAD